MASSKVHVVSAAALRDVILTRMPYGLFLTWEAPRWVAVDNADGNAWTEAFRSKRNAMRWLRRAFEVCR